ncbi:small GTP-binding protein domain [Edhazardia aedis USNM 41457]|uniref:Small GTP-binding protein domain n=1 Tax=Edhazardia aedis (strain USNM 41457) TaxID=1003232 RepID=J8ZZ86_EDHAE|nr:small GTP-binding protein domain [Edhazardia aedis USNM 41457]|eukprot:EJW04993.1 small GTP-binding protein domain [Edhazardia aedis USNM 41457]
MGFFFSRLIKRREKNVLFLGLEHSGKTTLLQMLLKLTSKPHKRLPLTPTMGFNTESIQFGNKRMIVWDLSGNENVRTYWSCYYTNVHGIVYCIDSSVSHSYNLDLNILKELAERQELKMSVFLILLTKKDNKSVINKEDASEVISQIFKDKQMKLFEISYNDTSSISNAFTWFTTQL